MTEKRVAVHNVNGANLVWNPQVDGFMLILYDAADPNDLKPEEQVGVPVRFSAERLQKFRDQIDYVLKKRARGGKPMPRKDLQ